MGFSAEWMEALEVVAADRAANFDPLAEWPLVPEGNYFVSGSNHPGEIAGLALSGVNVGVAANHVSPKAEAELALLGGGPTKVFVDSGAFGEVVFPEDGPPVVKKAITPKEWAKRLGLYRRLAAALRGQLYCVAPDKVGFQEETFERLAAYKAEILELKALGANVIVPLQKGALSLAAARERAVEILGTDDFVWGIPMKKDATSMEDLAGFADALFLTAKPTRIHLLGLGVTTNRYLDALNAVLLRSPWTTVFSDSVRITALVGRGGKRANGKSRGNVRPLTAATDAVKAAGTCKDATEWKAAAIGIVWKGFAAAQLAEARRLGWYDPELESAPGVPLPDEVEEVALPMAA